MVAQASRSVSPLSAALLDLDHFKHVNDAHGHSRGDEVLAAVAATLRSSLRESDFVGRYGGEQFLILLPDTGKQQARTVAEKVRAAVEATVLSNLELRVTASLGVPACPTTAATPTRSSAPPTGPCTPPRAGAGTGSSCSSRSGAGPRTLSRPRSRPGPSPRPGRTRDRWPGPR